MTIFSLFYVQNIQRVMHAEWSSFEPLEESTPTSYPNVIYYSWWQHKKQSLFTDDYPSCRPQALTVMETSIGMKCLICCNPEVQPNDVLASVNRVNKLPDKQSMFGNWYSGANSKNSGALIDKSTPPTHTHTHTHTHTANNLLLFPLQMSL